MNKPMEVKFLSSLYAITIVLTGLFSANLIAQGLPQTDIWLASLGKETLEQPGRINPSSGYNNQPHFSIDGAVVFYTREMPAVDAASQTDIAAYQIDNMATTMVNASKESEYSPTPIPGRDAVSVIRQDLSGGQFLWAINISSGEMELLLPGIEPVGYHAWFNDDSVAMFILGDSFTLQTATLGEESTLTVADNIGRSIRRHPQTGEVLFVDKNTQPWQISAFNPHAGTTRSVMPLFPEGEDFTIDSKGDYWTGNGSRLYRRSTDASRWHLMADFSALGIANITRLAISPNNDKIAIVADQTVSQ